MKIKDLKKGFSAFGNKGAVWSNEIHITDGWTSLCGTPLLSTNWARPELQKELGYDRDEIGCKKCLEAYLSNQKSFTFSSGDYSIKIYSTDEDEAKEAWDSLQKRNYYPTGREWYCLTNSTSNK